MGEEPALGGGGGRLLIAKLYFNDVKRNAWVISSLAIFYKAFRNYQARFYFVMVCECNYKVCDNNLGQTVNFLEHPLPYRGGKTHTKRIIVPPVKRFSIRVCM